MSKLSSQRRVQSPRRVRVAHTALVVRDSGVLTLSYIAGRSPGIHINRSKGRVIERVQRDISREVERMERAQGHRCICGKVYDNAVLLPSKCVCGRSLHTHYWANADRLVTQLPPARGDYRGRVSVDGQCPMCGTPTEHGHPICGCAGYSIERTDNSAAVFHADAAKRAGDRRSHWHQPGDGTLRDDRERRVKGAAYYELSVVKRGSKAKKVVRKPPKTHEYVEKGSKSSQKVLECQKNANRVLASITDTELFNDFNSFCINLNALANALNQGATLSHPKRVEKSPILASRGNVIAGPYCVIATGRYVQPKGSE